MTSDAVPDLATHETYVRQILRPGDPTADGNEVRWTEWLDKAPVKPLSQLLDAYCALAAGLPDELVAFVRDWGVPELGHIHGDPEKRADWSTELAAPKFLPMDRVREHARGLTAARRLGAALTTKQPTELSDWRDANRFLDPSSRNVNWPNPYMPDEITRNDWRLEREHFGTLLSRALRSPYGVGVGVNWVDQNRLALNPVANSLVGVVLLLLAREVGSDGQYPCASCGSYVTRRRAPLQSQAVYCDRPECKREQQRRNQARWRAKRQGQKPEGEVEKNG